MFGYIKVFSKKSPKKFRRLSIFLISAFLFSLIILFYGIKIFAFSEYSFARYITVDLDWGKTSYIGYSAQIDFTGYNHKSGDWISGNMGENAVVSDKHGYKNIIDDYEDNQDPHTTDNNAGSFYQHGDFVGVTPWVVINTPTRDGHRFLGWSTNTDYFKWDGAESYYFEAGCYAANSGDINITALWAVYSHTITYNGNGATSNIPGNQTKTYGSAMNISSQIPVRKNYVFGGWACSKGGTYQPGASYYPDYDGGTVTMTAIWTPYQHTVVYNGNGATSNVPANQTKTFGVAMNISSQIPVKTGCIFKGWLSSKGGTYQAGSPYTGNYNGGTVTMTAIWESNIKVSMPDYGWTNQNVYMTPTVTNFAPYVTSGYFYNQNNVLVDTWSCIGMKTVPVYATKANEGITHWKFKATDTSGASAECINTVKIDITPPEQTNIDNENDGVWIDSEYWVYYEYSDLLSGIKNVQVWNLAGEETLLANISYAPDTHYVSDAIDCDLEGYEDYAIKVTDWAGNETWDYFSTMIDVTNPEITNLNVSDWTNSDVTINPTFRDVGYAKPNGNSTSPSGIFSYSLYRGTVINEANIVKRVGPVSGTPSAEVSTVVSGGINYVNSYNTSESFTVEQNQVYTLIVRDYAGNAYSKQFTVKIDKSVPIIENLYVPGGWYSGDITINPSTRDLLSGVKSFNLYPKDQPSTLLVNSAIKSDLTSSFSYTFSSEQAKTYTLKSTDNAGNITLKDFDVKIDKTAPVISGLQSLYGWSNSNINLSVNVNDSLSGLNKAILCPSDEEGYALASINSNGILSYNFVNGDTGNYYILAYDNAGNYVRSDFRVQIDSVVPEYSHATQTKISGGYQTTVDAYDYGGSGLKNTVIKRSSDNYVLIDAPKAAMSPGDVNFGGYISSILTSSNIPLSVSLYDYAGNVTNFHSVVFNENGGSGFVPAIFYKIGSNITLPANTLTNPGMTFAGWSLTADGSSGIISAGSIFNMTSSNQTYYAIWTPNSNTPYQVNHYQMNLDGTTYTLIENEKLYGTTGNTVIPAVKTYTGFNSPSTKSVVIAADGSTVVNYYYERKKFVLNLNGFIKGTKFFSLDKYAAADVYVNGVRVAQGISDFYQEVYYGSSYSITNILTIPGFVYDGTAYNVGQAGYSPLSGIITDTTVVYPMISRIEYTISYTLNDGSVSGNPTSYNVETPTFTLNNPSFIGYVFNGWTGSNSTTPQTTVSIPLGSTGNKTFTANRSPINYTVNYNGNGATGGSTVSSNHTYDVAKRLTSNGFVKSYNVSFNANGGSCSTASLMSTASFIRWNTLANNSGTSYSNNQSVINLLNTPTSMTLYAQWSAMSSITLPTPVWAGHVFNGWTESLATGIPITGSYVPSKDITLYALWVMNTPTIDVLTSSATLWQGQNYLNSDLWNMVKVGNYTGENGCSMTVSGDCIVSDGSGGFRVATENPSLGGKTYNVTFTVTGPYYGAGLRDSVSKTVQITILKVIPTIAGANNNYYQGIYYDKYSSYYNPDSPSSVPISRVLTDSGIKAWGCDKATGAVNLSWCNKDLTGSIIIKSITYIDALGNKLITENSPTVFNPNIVGTHELKVSVTNYLNSVAMNTAEFTIYISVRENMPPTVASEERYFFIGDVINRDTILQNIIVTDKEDAVNYNTNIDSDLVARVKAKVSSNADLNVRQIINNTIKSTVLYDGDELSGSILVSSYNAQVLELMDIYNNQSADIDKIYVNGTDYYNWYGFSEKGVYRADMNKSSITGADMTSYYDLYSKTGFDKFGLRTSLDSSQVYDKELSLWVRDGFGKKTTGKILLHVVSATPEQKYVRFINNDYLADFVDSNPDSKWVSNQVLFDKLTTSLAKDGSAESSAQVWTFTSDEIKNIKQNIGTVYTFSPEGNSKFLQDFAANKIK